MPEPQALSHELCRNCNFDLHGRRYGERCPECGAVFERLAPPWWNAESLGRIARAAARAKWASLALLPLPVLALVMAATGTGRFFSGETYVFIACGMLLLQVGFHAAALATVARQLVGLRVRRRLRIANTVRVAALHVAAAAVIVHGAGVKLPEWTFHLAYLGVPLAMGASDLEAIQKCINLSDEVGWLVPVIGWFIVGPLLWFGGLALCFRELERFGRGARGLVSSAAADDGVLDARAAGGSA